MSGVIEFAKRFISDTKETYRKGVERFGVWWKILMFSVLGLIIFFILLAMIIAVLFL